jgi:hypothetical protein
VPAYYLQDTIGSVIGMANHVGVATGTMDYDGFGNVSEGDAVPASTAGDLRFQGM